MATREPLTLGTKMVDVTEARKIIQQESVRFRGSVSEAVAFTLAAAINFINKRQFDKHSWHLNGDVAQLQAQSVGDGVFICLEDIEVFGYAIYNGKSGVNGLTEIDLHKVLADGTDEGSIFTTKPTISPSAADGSFQVLNLANGGSEEPTGHTLGEFSLSSFDKFDGIRLDLDSAMGASEDLQVIMFFRPR